MSNLWVLVIGSGGREHALAWALSRSPQVERVYIAPGNGGTQWPASPGRAAAINVPIGVEEIALLLVFARENRIDLTVVGPEAPLALGIVDNFQDAAFRIFGPTSAAATLESSKVFAKNFMQRFGIPTADYRTFDDYPTAQQFVRDFGRAVVVKADGLAAGKGVFVCDTVDEADSALRQIFQNFMFGAAGNRVVIEERLTGPELSVLAFADGKGVAVMPPARDHKRAYDNDEGPNTGGMGAFAPVPGITIELMDEINQTVLQPAMDSMTAQGIPFTGILYAGLMLTPNGINTLEFNCRFGDPEAQAILPLLETDVVDILQACIDGTLDQLDIRWKSGACAAIVAASQGYPDDYPKGLPISGIDSREDVLVFHAGTEQRDGQLVTSGGRVLAVSATGDDLNAALAKAYAGMAGIQFDGMHYRRDIGQK